MHVDTARETVPFLFPDPMEPDSLDDDVLAVSRRGLIRLALVASETGARFAREGIAQNPMAWLLAPRRIFGGRAAVDACLGLGACSRAVLLHGLGLALDADADELDDLLAENSAPDFEDDGAVEQPSSARVADAVIEARAA